MADIKVIGAVAVKVRPDASGFREATKQKILNELRGFTAEAKVDLDLNERELKRDIERIKRDAKNKMDLTWTSDSNSIDKAFAKVEQRIKDLDDIKLSATLDEGALAKASTDLDKAIEDVKNVMLKITPDDVSVDKTIRRLKDAISEVESNEADIHAVAHTAAATAQMRYTTRPRFADIFVRINKRSLATTEGMLQSLAGLNTLRSLGNGLEDLAVNFDQITIKSTLLSSALAGVVNTLSYVATSMLSIGEGIFESVGLLATAPAAMAALTAAVVITTAAFDDFGAAVDGDAEALARLPEHAQEAARALQGTWDMIQKPVQEAFWEGMGDSLAEVVEVLMPQFRDGLTLSAKHAGDFAQGVADAFKTIADNGDLEEMFRNLAGGFDTASEAAEPFVEALNTLGLRGSEYLPQFGQWLTDISKQFNRFIQLADANGDINRWIEQGIDSLKDMWTVGGSVVDMFRALTSAANAAGMQGLDEFADNMRGIADMMLAEPFQTQMATIFEGANEGARELADGVEDLGKAVGDSADFVGELLTKLGTLGGGVLKGLATAISQIEFQEGMLDSLDGMNQLVGDLTPTFEALGRVVGSFGSIAGDVFRNLAPVINTVMDTLDEGMSSLGPALERLAPALADLLNNLVTVLSGPLLAGVEGLSAVITGLAEAPPIVRDLVMALGALTALRIGGFFTSFSQGLATMTGNLTGSKKSISTWRVGIARQFAMTQQTLNSLSMGGFQRSMTTMQQTARRGTLGVTKALTGMVSFLGGPWGLAVGAVAIGALSAFGQAQAEAEAHVRSLTDSLDEQSGAATNNTITRIADDLAQDSIHFLEWASGVKEAGDAARILGTDLTTLAGIVAGDKQTYQEYIDMLSKYPGAYGKTTMSMEKWAKQMGISEDAARSLGVAGVLGLIDDLKQQRGALAESKEGWKEYGNAAKDAGKTAQEVAADFKNLSSVDVTNLGGAFQTLADHAGNATDRVSALKDVIDILNGKTPDAEEALGNVAETMDNLGTVFKDASGNAYDFSNAIADNGKISQATPAMRGLYDAVNGLGDQMLAAASGMDAAGEPASAIAQKLSDMQAEFARSGEAAGLSAAQVEAAFNRYINATPEEIAIMLDMDIDPLKSKAEIADAKLRQYEAAKAVAKLAGDNTQLGVELATSYDDLEQWDKAVGTATADLNPKAANKKREALERSLITLAMMDPTVKADMDPRLFHRAEERVLARIRHLDKQKPSPLVNAQTAEARGRLQAIRDMLAAIDKTNTTSKHTHTNLIRNITTHEAVNVSGGKGATPTLGLPQYNAKGNLYDGNMKAMKFADGGITSAKLEKPGTAKIYSPLSQYRVFAEPETGGEAYIPLASSKRARSEKILGEVASKFGGSFTKNTQSYAMGGISGSTTSELPINLTINSVPSSNAQEVADTIMSSLRHAKRGGVYSGA